MKLHSVLIAGAATLLSFSLTSWASTQHLDACAPTAAQLPTFWISVAQKPTPKPPPYPTTVTVYRIPDSTSQTISLTISNASTKPQDANQQVSGAKRMKGPPRLRVTCATDSKLFVDLYCKDHGVWQPGSEIVPIVGVGFDYVWACPHPNVPIPTPPATPSSAKGVLAHPALAWLPLDQRRLIT